MSEETFRMKCRRLFFGKIRKKYRQFVVCLICTESGKTRVCLDVQGDINYLPGTSCSKLMMSLVNVSLKLLSLNMEHM